MRSYFHTMSNSELRAALEHFGVADTDRMSRRALLAQARRLQRALDEYAANAQELPCQA